MAGSDASSGWDVVGMEKDLQSMMRDGFLSDLTVVEASKLKVPKSVAPWSHLPVTLYESPTATRVFKTLLNNVVPGISSVTYAQVLSAIMQQTHTDCFCYLLGGQVRDLLKGKISTDVDFNYACTAKDVAMVCVENEWPVKFKAIGPVEKPNYVMIGDEQSEFYMEGFSISFNATSECYKQDFRQNMLFYDLTNNVILDKSGYGVTDIRDHQLRLSCAPGNNFEDWASADMTLGQKALRYVKFVVRSKMRQTPLKVDKEESAFVASLLRKAFQENSASLKGFWFGYVLGECLKSQEGIQGLYTWVCDQEDGKAWWLDWLPFVKPTIRDVNWLQSLAPLDNVEGQADTIKQVFVSCDSAGDGLIGQEDLKTLMRNLNGNLSDGDLEVLCESLRPAGSGKVKYDDFVNSLLGLPVS